MLERPTPPSGSIIHVDFVTGGRINKDLELEEALRRTRNAHYKNPVTRAVCSAVDVCLGKPLNGLAYLWNQALKKLGNGSSHLLRRTWKEKTARHNSGGHSWTEQFTDMLENILGKHK